MTFKYVCFFSCDKQKYNGVIVSNWTLKINQYRQKEDEQKPNTTKPSTVFLFHFKLFILQTISLVYSSSLDGYVLISGKSNAIIADKAISIVYTSCLGYLTNTYTLKVEVSHFTLDVISQGKEYRINDVIIRYGMISVAEKMQGVFVLDVSLEGM